MMTMKRWILGAGFCALMAAPAAAQMPAAGWAVEARAGAQLFDNSSALETGASLGVDALYFFNPRLGVGPAIDYVMTKSDGEFFVEALPFGPDSTRIFQVGQVVSALNYALVGVFDILPESRYAPYVALGGGGYRLYLDAETNNAPRRVDGGLIQAGGGIRFSLSDAAGVRLDARDMIYLGYDRDQLDPRDARYANCGPPPSTVCFPGENADVPDEKSTIHNFRISLGFTYVPSMNR